MTSSSQGRKKQASIEKFVSTSPLAGQSAAAGGCKPGGSKAGSVPPSPPSFAEFKGQPVLKDFFCDNEKRVRPFRGIVKAYKARHKWYKVKYEDGDGEDLAWEDLYPLMQRAAAADAKGAAAAASARSQQSAALALAGKQQHKSNKPAATDKQQQKGSKPAAASKELSLASKKPAAKELPPVTKKPAAKKPGSKPSKHQTKEETMVKKAVKKAAAAGEAGAKQPRKRKAPTAEEGSSDEGSEQVVKRKKETAGPKINLLLPKMGQQYEYARGKEPWRSLEGFSWVVHDELDLSAAAVNEVRTVQRTFNKYFIRAEVDEKERVDQILADQKTGKAKQKARPANRPDRATESRMKKEQLAIRRQVAGHFPGWDIGSRAYSRAEISCLGFHLPPIAGIDFVQKGRAGNRVPAFATSVMVSGWYQDNSDSGAELWYTGEGGNDLLHGRNQVADQVLKRGNAALLGNIQLGIPVRVTRKQKDPHGHYGCAYIYDGLYNVTAYRHVQGKEKTWVYQFCLRRRSGQGPLLSQLVKWGGIAAARVVVPKTRQGVVDLDISRGKEEKPIPAVDDTWLAEEDHHKPHGDIPPCTGLSDVVDEGELVGKMVRGINQERIAELRAQGYAPSVQYITEYEFVGRAAAKAGQLQRALLPPEFRSEPHAFLRKLNHGTAYNDRGQLFNPRPVVYECCSTWTGCPEGKDCPLAVTQRGPKYRIEVFKTSNGRGWGLRSLDTLPQFGFVCLYVGQVFDAEEHEHLVRTVEEQDAEYTFDMVPRPDTNWDGSEKECPDERKADFVACGLRKRNVGAFLNHSCAPNCFVQPVLDTHHDLRCPKICIFASENIAPLTELTLDYGGAYAAGFQGGCKCGAGDCVSLRPLGAPPAAAPALEKAPEQAEEEEEEQAYSGEEEEEQACSGEEEEEQAYSGEEEEEEEGQEGYSEEEEEREGEGTASEQPLKHQRDVWLPSDFGLSFRAL